MKLEQGSYLHLFLKKSKAGFVCLLKIITLKMATSFLFLKLSSSTTTFDEGQNVKYLYLKYLVLNSENFYKILNFVNKTKQKQMPVHLTSVTDICLKGLWWWYHCKFGNCICLNFWKSKMCSVKFYLDIIYFSFGTFSYISKSVLLLWM